MTLHTFKKLLSEENPPATLHGTLLAMWKAGRGDWHGAHDLVQDDEGGEAAWVHAYLHREEGDLFNAGYWYRRAGRPVCKESLEAEWDEIVSELLGE